MVIHPFHDEFVVVLEETRRNESWKGISVVVMSLALFADLARRLWNWRMDIQYWIIEWVDHYCLP